MACNAHLKLVLEQPPDLVHDWGGYLIPDVIPIMKPELSCNLSFCLD